MAGSAGSESHGLLVTSAASVVYEAPSRVVATLRDLAAACGPDRPAAVCRELTKLHEEIVRAPIGLLASRAADGEITLRGEFAIVVGEQPGGIASQRGDGGRRGCGTRAATRRRRATRR